MIETEPPLEQPRKSRVPAWVRGFVGGWGPRDLLFLCVCPVIGLLAAYGSERIQSRGFVLPGVSVDETDVSGYGAAVVDEFLRSREEQVSKRVLRVKVGNSVYRLTGEELGSSLEPDTAARILAAGRTGNVLGQIVWRAARLSSFEELTTRYRLSDERIEEHLHTLEKAALPTPTEGEVRFVDGKVEAVYPAEGETIDRRYAGEVLREAVNTGVLEVTLPTVRWSPSTTKAAVDDAKRRFERAIAKPVEMFVRFPSTEVPGEQVDGQSDEEQQARVETLSPKVFAPLLSARRASNPELELVLDTEALDKALADVRKRWERPAKNAQFVLDKKQKQKLRIEPSSPQWVLPSDTAAAALLAAIESDEKRGVWELVTGEQPKITTELAQQLNINEVVSSFTTHHPCCKPRVANIHRIADLIDGTVVLPGETYSVNETLGPRTAANGFTMAPTIVKGEMDDTVGGGISQFATTLFNAVLRGGYEIIERQPHSIYFNRYPMGHEATLSYPKPDLIFKNDTPSGMVIKTHYTKTSITVFIYGDNNGRVVTTDVSKPFDRVEPGLEYLADPALAPDEEKIDEKGEWGFTVFASRTVKEKDGTERKESRKVIYKPRARRLIVHPCNIPEGFEGHTGEKCPEPELEESVEEAVEGVAEAVKAPAPLPDEQGQNEHAAY
jgi:vancomycin resistance protein YoaR